MTKNDTDTAAMRHDGYLNAFISRGIKQYRANNSFFSMAPLNFQQLNELWYNPLARKIAQLPAEAALKKGFVIDGDKDKAISKALEEMSAQTTLIDAMIWGRHYGRSCVFMLLEDGRLEDEPVDYVNLRRIKGMMVLDAQSIQEDFSGYLLNDDISDPNYGKPEWYTIIPPRSGLNLYVHHSRLLMFDGDPVPEYMRIQRGGVGLSCIEGAVKSLLRLDTGHSTALNVLERISTALIKFNNLAEVLSTEQGDELVQKRLELIDLARNVINCIALSKDDEFQVFNVPVSGIDALLESFAQFLAAETNIPYSLLFGRKQGGLNTSGESDLENYYGYVAGIQARVLLPQLKKLIDTLMCCSEGPTRGKKLDYSIRFNALWEPTQKEQVETAKIQAEKDKTIVDTVTSLLDRQLIGQEEARQYLAKRLNLHINDALSLLDDDDDSATE